MYIEKSGDISIYPIFNIYFVKKKENSREMHLYNKKNRRIGGKLLSLDYLCALFLHLYALNL